MVAGETLGLPSRSPPIQLPKISGLAVGGRKAPRGDLGLVDAKVVALPHRLDDFGEALVAAALAPGGWRGAVGDQCVGDLAKFE